MRLDFETGKPARLSRGHLRPAIFLDRDGVINKEVSHLSDPAQMELIPGAAEAIRRLNEAGFLVIVVTNQPVIARGECTLDVLRLIHNKMETLLGRKHAWIDALYFCPHHPDEGFAGEIPELKVDCACRKPKTGMFDQAVRDWNISLSGSFGVGDTRRDVLAARRMGIVAIGVKTGHGCRDCDALRVTGLARRRLTRSRRHHSGVKWRNTNMITTQTPFRISFFGGGSDIRSFYSRYPGAVLQCCDQQEHVSDNPSLF